MLAGHPTSFEMRTRDTDSSPVKTCARQESPVTPARIGATNQVNPNELAIRPEARNVPLELSRPQRTVAGETAFRAVASDAPGGMRRAGRGVYEYLELQQNFLARLASTVSRPTGLETPTPGLRGPTVPAANLY